MSTHLDWCRQTWQMVSITHAWDVIQIWGRPLPLPACTQRFMGSLTGLTSNQTEIENQCKLGIT